MTIKHLPEQIVREISANANRFYTTKETPTKEMCDELEKLTAAELFEHYCAWHGLIGWSRKLSDVWEALNGRPVVQAAVPSFRRDDLDFWLKVTGSELTIGTKVKVDQANAGASDWKSDWKGIELIVVGILLNPVDGKADIHLSDGTDITDSFSVHDLLPVN